MIFTPGQLAAIAAGTKTQHRVPALPGDAIYGPPEDIQRIERGAATFIHKGGIFAGTGGRVRGTLIRWQRLQDIAEADAIANGCFPDVLIDRSIDPMYGGQCWARHGFINLWEKIHGHGAWDRNGPVYVLTLEAVPGGVPARREVVNA